MSSRPLTNSNYSDHGGELEQYIVSLRQAVHGLPEGSSERSRNLYEVANLLREHYIASNGEKSLIEALSVAREAVKAIPDGSPMAATCLNNLGRLLRHKFVLERDPRDLDEAVEVFRRSVDVSKEDDSSWPQWLTDVGDCIYTRYDVKESLPDLEESIELARRALKDTTEDDPETIDLVIDLMVRLRKSKRAGSVSASEEAVDIAKRLLESSPKEHSSRSTLLHLLAGSFSDRYVLTGTIDDLNQQIVFSRQAIDSTSIDDPERVSRLAGLAVDLSDRIATMAFEQTQEGSDDWATHACNLSGYLLTLYQRTGEQLDLDTAIALAKGSVDATPTGNTLRHIRLGNLSACLIARFDSKSAFEDLEECVKMGNEAKEATPKEHVEWPARLHDLGAILQRRYQMTQDLEDLDEAIGLTQQALFALGPSHPQQADTMSLIALFFAKRYGETESPEDLHSDKQDLLLKIGGVSSETAGLALHLGEDPSVALSLLEKGRGMFALSLDEMRADTKSLEEQTLDTEDPEWNVDESRRHEAGDEFESLLAGIRQQPGFETFLFPPSESEIKLAADSGSIIIINTSMLRCDAIWLRVIRSHLSDEALEWLWDCVARPVLNALGFDKPPSERDWPHVWWIMTGLLNKFPIHAAGYHLKGSSETVIDRVISSYHSSIRSIIHGRKRPISAATQTNALLIAMEATPGHARTDPEDPIGSYLCLDKEREKCLTVLDLLDINLQSHSPFLAYLSACGTGRIDHNDLADEGIHLMNGFHTAGFRHVIGTSWEVKDEICVDMARITYEVMMQNGMPDEAVSRGLHEASRELRDRCLTMARTDHRTIGSLQLLTALFLPAGQTTISTPYQVS
ncbi:hypothetical protein DER44DRAFT_807375 [Fusarium oxysporum]|nr:hypothetical protein DER44DRAFT_807375 [Fusarium oxysporum]